MTAGSSSTSRTGVWVLGGSQTDFARHLTREGHDVSDLVGEIVDGTLEAARATAADVEVIPVGNAFGQLFTGQGRPAGGPLRLRPRAGRRAREDRARRRGGHASRRGRLGGPRR